MKPAWILFAVAFFFFLYSAYAENPKLTYAEAVEQARAISPKCIEREDGALFRAIKRSEQPEGLPKWEQCTVEAGWVQGPVVDARMTSDVSQKAAWHVAAYCRCQHD